MIDSKNSAQIKLKHNADYAELAQKLLILGERIIGAYSSIRDRVIFTDKRVIAVNVHGVTGKKRNYTSFPYKHIVVSLSKQPATSISIQSSSSIRPAWTKSASISPARRTYPKSSV